MKRFLLTLVVVCLAIFPVFGARDGDRMDKLMNFNWKFCLGDPAGAETVSYDDSA